MNRQPGSIPGDSHFHQVGVDINITDDQCIEAKAQCESKFYTYCKLVEFKKRYRRDKLQKVEVITLRLSSHSIHNSLLIKLPDNSGAIKI